mmetsp:Transcript_21943/g.61335  ORF Transcript_21943/g.61335 Transcript_21943/m.61335 type:complete len:232 (+) Transcript_21943:781-1476(+)
MANIIALSLSKEASHTPSSSKSSALQGYSSDATAETSARASATLFMIINTKTNAPKHIAIQCSLSMAPIDSISQISPPRTSARMTTISASCDATNIKLRQRSMVEVGDPSSIPYSESSGALPVYPKKSQAAAQTAAHAARVNVAKNSAKATARIANASRHVMRSNSLHAQHARNPRRARSARRPRNRETKENSTSPGWKPRTIKHSSMISTDTTRTSKTFAASARKPHPAT